MLLVAVVLFVIITADAPYRFVQLNSVDIQMPVMDGYEAAKRIRRIEGRPDTARLPIIAMTANAFDEDAKACFEAGMNAHLAKPFQMEKVVAVIAQFCRKA